MHTHHHEGDRRLLLGALCLIAGLMVVELVAGILADSLALLADAGHLVSDVAALAFAVAAATMAVAARARGAGRTAFAGWRSSPRRRTACCS